MGFHRDRDDKAFEFYKIMYTGLPWALFDFENPQKDANGYYVILKTKTKIEMEMDGYDKYKDLVDKYGGIMCLSGDADFGMKSGSTFYKQEESYGQVCRIIHDPDDRMHSNCNFSLLPVNGGMNCRKGFKKYRDIFPFFLYAISQYYEITDLDKKRRFVEENLGIIAAGGRQRKGMSEEEKKAKNREMHHRFYEREIPALICFLDTFDSFENYCVKTYFWGEDSDEIKKLLEDIKEFGASVDNVSFYDYRNVKKYCELANRYWQIRSSIIGRKYNGNVL